MERKKNEIYKEEQKGDSRFSTPRYNLSLSACIQNMNFLCYTVVEIPWAKKYGEKERTQGRTNKRRLNFIPTMQLGIVNLYILDEKVLRTYRRTDGRMGGQKDGQM